MSYAVLAGTDSPSESEKAHPTKNPIRKQQIAHPRKNATKVILAPESPDRTIKEAW